MADFDRASPRLSGRGFGRNFSGQYEKIKATALKMRKK
jgi:hypothetical protein